MEEPLLERGEEFFLQSFQNLSTCRPVSMDLGRIPWTAIHTYATISELENDLIVPFIDIIMEMDRAFLKYISDKKSEG